jgi:hypothetical protein
LETPFDLLQHLVEVLEELGIPYAIGGSVASMAYARPRLTNDADIVAALRLGDVPRLLAHFPAPEYYVDARAVREAVLERTQFNIIHAASAYKLDIYLPENFIAQQQIAKARRMRALEGFLANFSPPEELIIRKLEAYAQGGSEKHLTDIAAMVDCSADKIDLQRVDLLVRREGLELEWEAVQKRLEKE